VPNKDAGDTQLFYGGVIIMEIIFLKHIFTEYRKVWRNSCCCSSLRKLV